MRRHGAGDEPCRSKHEGKNWHRTRAEPGRAGFRASAARIGGGARGIRSRLSGSPISRLSAAQTRQAPRQPTLASSNADNGHPTVLAKPAIRVIPVIGPRAARP